MANCFNLTMICAPLQTRDGLSVGFVLFTGRLHLCYPYFDYTAALQKRSRKKIKKFIFRLSV